MGERGYLSLSYPVRGAVLVKHLGNLLVVLAVLECIPLGVSVYFQDFMLTFRYGLLIAAFGLSGWLMGRTRAPSDMRINEALVLTVLIFSLSSLGATLPFSAVIPGFTDALFEAVSAITTTGLSTLPTLEGLPKTFLFTRAYLQWLGGLGIVVFSVAVLIGPGVAARRLSLSDRDAEGVIHPAAFLSRRILKIYVLLTAGGVLILLALGMKFFPALLHTLASVSTGGFSPDDSSLAALAGPVQQGGVLLLSFLGSISLPLYYFTKKKGPVRLFSDPEVRSLVIVLAGSITLFTVALGIADGWGWAAALRHGPLTAISAQTTAGFSTTGTADLPAAAKMVLILSMAVGGATGSTAGGIKIFRLLVLVGLVRIVLVRTAMPRHAVARMRIGGQNVDKDEVNRVLATVILFIFTIVISWTAFIAAGYDPFNSLFDITSATGTVGLSAGIVGPDLPAFLKLILCMDMMLGRLEILCLLVVFYPWTWKGMTWKGKREAE